MFRRLLPYVALFSFAILFISGCTCRPASEEELSVLLHPQETGMWCWAASGQMIMDYLGNNVAQCVQANNRFGRSDCCNIDLCPTPETSHACVRGGWPEFDKYGFTFTTTSNAALSWDEVREELSTSRYCEKTPFAFTWRWLGGGGHMMVAKGYRTIGSVNYVRMLDPWPPCVGDERIITYDEYVADPGSYTHWDDYYEVR